ncbi:MAG: hypothetical protein N2438_10490 [Limisphaera sp.]|nr:hypothetical protein [Limisphaera sp.]
MAAWRACSSVPLYRARNRADFVQAQAIIVTADATQSALPGHAHHQTSRMFWRATPDITMKPSSLALLVIGFLAIPSTRLQVQATVRVFADKNAFAYALGEAPQARVTFDDLPEGPISGTEFTNAGFVFSSPLPPPAGQLEVAPADFFWSSPYLNIGKRPYAAGDDGENDSLNIDILGEWTAAALEFVDAWFPGNAVTTITFYGRSSNVLYTVSAQNRNLSFIGIIADEPIQWIRINEAANDADDVGYDNFWLGNPAPVAVDAPALGIATVPEGVILRWPASVGDYRLEASDSVETGAWEPVQEAAVFENGFMTVILRADREVRFFRLRKAD